MLVCVSCPNVQSVLGGPHCFPLRDISQALCAAELHEACLSGLSPAFESTCLLLFVSLL